MEAPRQVEAEYNQAPKRDNELLDSWKEIAVFLGRGVRTVQRWEATEGLPVRRHDHLKRGSVYALRSDVALWARTRQFGFQNRVNRYPMYHCDELRAQIRQHRAILNDLQAELQIRIAAVQSSWKQLLLSSEQADENVRLGQVILTLPGKSQAPSPARRASA